MKLDEHTKEMISVQSVHKHTHIHSIVFIELLYLCVITVVLHFRFLFLSDDADVVTVVCNNQFLCFGCVKVIVAYLWTGTSAKTCLSHFKEKNKIPQKIPTYKKSPPKIFLSPLTIIIVMREEKGELWNYIFLDIICHI